jgi:hypothetical protein
MKPRWYHWILLVVCALLAFVEGVLDVIGGAGPGPLHEIDDVAVRLIGAGLAVFGILIFMRKSWAFWGLIYFFAMSVAEIELTLPHISAALRGLLQVLFVRVSICVFFAIPVLLLIWLRHVFVAPNPAPEPN